MAYKQYSNIKLIQLSAEKINPVILLYINPQLKLELVLIDERGRFPGAEVNLHRTKTVVLGIYASADNKVLFYKQIIDLRYYKRY